MSTIRKTITLTAQQDAWIKTQIANGEYTNDSEYLRDLIRRDQEENAHYKALKNAVLTQGQESLGQQTVAEVWEAAAQYRQHVSPAHPLAADTTAEAKNRKKAPL
jgi:antitoxin ParD1/3/4